MRRWWWFLLAAALVAAGAPLLYGQAGERRGGGRGGGRGADTGAMELERLKFTLTLLGLSSQEQAAAEKSMEAKLKARQALEAERDKLRLAGDTPGATDQQLAQAVAAYTKAMATYRAVVQKEDAALAKKLSARSRARGLAAGVLDNGLGAGRSRQGGGRTGGRGRGEMPPGGAPE